jgi:hypothetical protein
MKTYLTLITAVATCVSETWTLNKDDKKADPKQDIQSTTNGRKYENMKQH